ncbi:MAG: DNA photolyase [Proteobacteria bacterium]|nr:DNA photolyase [Pseudomonadota bacterium]MBU1717034.1 DNA photolyase [Pseudomonadota bacterium]
MLKKQPSKNPSPFSDPSELIRRIYVEESILDLPYTREILTKAKPIPVEIIKDRCVPDLPGGQQKGGMAGYIKNLTLGKQNLFLSLNRGRFLKACPATREYRCCDYQVLNIGMNCPMDCVYCILQAYMNNPWLSFYVNVDDLLAELDEAFRSEPQTFRRIGTGEFTDSMALDRLTGLSRILVEYMSGKQTAVLELKTKTAVIDNLQGIDHKGRTVVSWSLNSPVIMQKEELKTASLNQRLEAASRCAEMGYKIGFHFDPVIFHPGWQQGYAETISRMFAAVPPEKIVWISIGALRYLPALKSIATTRFPNSNFFHEEFITGLDNKSRYFRPLRVEMYKLIHDLLRANANARTCIYLCMESDEIWQEVFGFSPEDKGGLPAMLDRAVN